MPLARRTPEQWRGGLLPPQLGGLLDMGYNYLSNLPVFDPAQYRLSGWPSIEQLQETAQARGMPTPDEIAEMALDLGGPFTKIGGLLGHTVWHGSPHKWDVPDISKVGTGEGNQMFGHGFYSADTRDVAKSYMGTGEARYARTTGQMNPMEEFASDLYAQGQTDDDVFSAMYAKYKSLMSTDDGMDAVDSAIRVGKESQGHLYKLDIPDEDVVRYLDWDKPLSEQSASVQESLRKAFKDRGFDEWQINAQFEKNITGEQAHAYIGGIKGQQAGSAALNAAGIPGIRYLDQGSRSAGEGTYNYVTFDPSRIKVLERK